MPNAYSDADKDLITYLYCTMGLSRGQIAFLYGVTRNTICSRIFRLGISRKGPRSPHRQLPHPLKET